MDIDMTDHNPSHANSTDRYNTLRQKSSSPGPPKVMIYTVQILLEYIIKLIYNSAAI